VRFSNANTTTDRYRFGARPDFPHACFDAAGVVEDNDCLARLDLGSEERAVERADEPQLAMNIPKSASIVVRRRHETTRVARRSDVTSPACPLAAPRCRRPGG
jgi:hypothetical protein